VRSVTSSWFAPSPHTTGITTGLPLRAVLRRAGFNSFSTTGFEASDCSVSKHISRSATSRPSPISSSSGRPSRIRSTSRNTWNPRSFSSSTRRTALSQFRWEYEKNAWGASTASGATATPWADV
jgi:hypothetical protein